MTFVSSDWEVYEWWPRTANRKFRGFEGFFVLVLTFFFFILICNYFILKSKKN